MSTNPAEHMGSFVTVGDGERRFDAYWSPSNAPSGKSIVLLHEIFGITEKIRRYADDLTRDGFNVLAPDLFWRTGRRLELDHDQQGIAKAMERLKTFSEDHALDDIAACVDWLRRRGERVALLGFCLGGKLVVLARMHGLADAYVGYYGVGVEKIGAPLDRNDVPLLMHYGADDPYAPLQTVHEFSPRLGSRAKVCVYEGAGHAFYRPGRDEASRLSRERTVEFLNEQLTASGGR